jgi:Ran GTPase-activating protein (RanGAP) involved in mRNA processing and transport
MLAIVAAALPEHIDYEKRVSNGASEADRRANFELAFETARKVGGCPRLLDVDDMFPVPEKLSTTLYVSELRKRLFDGISLSQCASRSASDTEEDDAAPTRGTGAVLTAAAEQLKHSKEVDERTKTRLREQKRQEAEDKARVEAEEKERAGRAAREADEKARKEKEERDKAARAARVQEALQKELEQSRGSVSVAASTSGTAVFAAPAKPAAVAAAAAAAVPGTGSGTPTLRRAGSTIESAAAPASGSGTPTLRRTGSTIESKNPKASIAAVAANDEALQVLDLSGNTMFSMKHREYAKELGAALVGNTHLRELHLKSCDLDKMDVQALMEGLTQNKKLLVLDLEKNKIDNEGATTLAVALRENVAIRELNLLNQAGRAFGDACLTAFVDMFDYNVTLTKIIWRLDSRKSFAINKLLVRNNTIKKNLEEGRDVSKIIPAHCNIAELLAGRSAGAVSAESDDANEEEPQDGGNSNSNNNTSADDAPSDEESTRKGAARKEAEERWKQEAAEEARLEAEKKALMELERKDKEAVKAKEEAERKAKEAEVLKLKQEVERKAKEELERQAKEAEAQKAKLEKAKEAEAQKAKEDADRKAKEAEAQKAQLEAEKKAKEEAERKAKEEAERKAKEAEAKDAEAQGAKLEAEKKAKDEKKAKEEVDRKAKEAEERKAKIEAEKKANEEAVRKTKEEAEKKAKKEAEKKAKEAEADKAKLEVEKKAKLEAEKKAKAEAEKNAKAEAEEKRLETERKASESKVTLERKSTEEERQARVEKLRQEAEAALTASFASSASAAETAAPADGALCWDCKTVNPIPYKYCNHCGAAPKKTAVAQPAAVAVAAKPAVAAVQVVAETPKPTPQVFKLVSTPAPKAAEAKKPAAAVVDKRASLRNVNLLRAVQDSPIGRIFFGPEASSQQQAVFVEFLAGKHCAELGLFLRDSATFKRIEKADVRVAEARRLLELYIAGDGDSANDWDSKSSVKLNLSASVVAEFRREYDADPSSVHVFDLVECECLTLIRANKFDADFVALQARAGRGTWAALPDQLVRHILLLAPLRDACRCRRVSNFFRRLIDDGATWEAMSARSNLKPHCRDLHSFVTARARSMRLPRGNEVVLNLAQLRSRIVLQSTLPLLPSHLAPATCYWEFEASGSGLSSLKGTVGVATLGGDDVRGVPFAGEHFFSDKTAHPSDCSPLAAGSARGVGLEWPTKQIFLVEESRLLFFESIAEMMPSPSAELYATVVIEVPPVGAIGTVKLDFNFGAERRFAYALDAHLVDRVPEVAQSLRLQEKYALPLIRCSLCGIQAPISDEGIVETHACIAPATPKKNDEAGCVLQ